MDHLRNSILLYFNHWNPEQVLQADFRRKQAFEQDEHSFSALTRGIKAFENRTGDEIRNTHTKLTEDWMYPPTHHDKGQQKPSVFYLLTHFTEQVLKEVEAEPFVQYEHLLKWRNLSFQLGEDLFTTSFLAYRDLIARKNRNYFAWRPILFSDNRRLHELLQKGVAENHSHLWASGLTFDFSWLALTNHYRFFQTPIKKLILENRQKSSQSTHFNSEKVEFEIQLQKAVALRLIIYLSLTFYEQKNRNNTTLHAFLDNDLEFSADILLQPSNRYNSYEFTIRFQEILDKITLIGIERGLKLPHNGNEKVVDYAANFNMAAKNFEGCYYLTGERNLLYRAFRILYSSLESNQDIHLFKQLLYAYLLIKNQFRNELIQVNDQVGFANFKLYQDRKFEFIGSNTLYQTLFLDASLNYNPTLMNIISNEQRIAPKNCGKSIKHELDSILRVKKYHQSNYYDWEKRLLGKSDLLAFFADRNIRLEEVDEDELYFVIHFLKRKDKLIIPEAESKKRLFKSLLQQVVSRDAELRIQVKKHALAIVEFRELYPDLARKVRGIDAASSELDARPEVYGQAFRMLKNHQLRSLNTEVKGELVNNRLNITFHAGEDFYDVVDGLRYIDECIRFLDMGIGDRIGHGVALGIDVSNYFAQKKRKIMLPKHLLLDNIAWLLSKVGKFGLGEHINEVYRLENIFKSLFSELYLNHSNPNNFQHINFQQFYHAWKLRGDDPEIYFDYFTRFSEMNILDYFTNTKNITYWDRCRLNRANPKLDSLRNRKEIARLYFEYHYNPHVKNNGSKIKQFEITPEYILLVQDVQIHMMHYVNRRNISIETNPTSNYLIGPINRYAEHPIIKWFNLGLETDVNKINTSPQLSVSVNTDDAGIFATSLENEYALLAIALEKEKDENGKPLYKPAMIYEWLDKIREMGIYQSFLDQKKR